MEVEYLFYDFTADPTALDRWRSLPLHRRNQEFGFGKLRQRKEERDQVPKDHVHLSRNEYRTHSAIVHPQPVHEIEVEGTDPNVRRSSLFMDLGDLVQHSNRLWNAALDYLESIGDTLPDVEVEDLPDVSAVSAAADMIRQSDRRRGVPTPPVYSHVTDDGRPRRDPSDQI